MPRDDIGASRALTTLLVQEPHENEDPEIRILPIRQINDGPKTLYRATEHLGNDIPYTILHDIGISTVKEGKLDLIRGMSDLICSSDQVMALLADISPI